MNSDEFEDETLKQLNDEGKLGQLFETLNFSINDLFFDNIHKDQEMSHIYVMAKRIMKKLILKASEGDPDIFIMNEHESYQILSSIFTN